MTDMNNFLYCHDPLNEDVGEYLLHLPHPTALIKIIDLEEEEPIASEEFIHKTYLYTGDEDDMGGEYQLVFTPPADGTGTVSSYSDEQVDEILDKAWEYWVQVLEWEEDQSEEDD